MKSVITTKFAKSPMTRKVDVILHEDLHLNMKHLIGTINQEAIVTPLAHLAAIKFFEYSGDGKNFIEMLNLAKRYRNVSKELNEFVKNILDIFSTEPKDRWYEKISEISQNYPNYMREFDNTSDGLLNSTLESKLEVKISHDFLYYRYFDRIMELAEQAPNLQTLIEDFKKAPAENPAFETYLAELEKKYKSR